MRIELLADAALIESTINSDGIREVVFEPEYQAVPGAVQKLLEQPDQAKFLGAFGYNHTYLGLFMFHRKGQVVWQGHQCMLPTTQGKWKCEAGYAALLWMFKNTACRKIVGETPVDLPHARRFVKRLGFRDEGINRMSFMRGDKLIDQWYLGLRRGELKCL